MSAPFNFYQYPFSVSGEDITPFSSFFTGIYFPLAAILGEKIPLFDDDTARPVSFRQSITGNVSSDNRDPNDMFLSISGDFFPSPLDNHDFSFDFTGNVNMDNIDIPSLSIPFSGAQSGQMSDIHTLTMNQTGNQSGAYNLSAAYQIDFYAYLSGYYNETSNLVIAFSGHFTKRQRDNASVDMNMFSVSYAVGAAIVYFNVTDDASIDYNLNQVLFKPA